MKISLKQIYFLVGSSFCALPAAYADNYFAISAGSSSYETSAFDPPFDSGLDESAGSFGLALGFQVNENFTVEIGYADYGKAKGEIYSESASFPFPYQYSEDAEIHITSIYFAGIGAIPMGSSASFLMMAGFEKWDGEGSWTFDYSEPGFSISDELANADDDGTDLFYGIGILFNLSSATGLSIIYDVHDFDTDLLDSIEIKQIKAKLNFNF